MASPYANWIQRWEQRLNRVDQDRRVTAFDWGAEWLRDTPVNGLPDWTRTTAPAEVLPQLRAWNQRVIADSGAFFQYPQVGDYRLDDHNQLSYSSPVPTAHRENHHVHGRWFPAHPGARAGLPRRAVIVVAQWNSDEEGHLGLCRLLSRAGVACLRLSMPYHDRRMPRTLKRAEFTVDPNIGRTIHAARQAVCDIRAGVDWLELQGFESLGIVGTSLGSCYALLASAHDTRLRLNVFNHISEYFGDVVWTGLATTHVRQGIEGTLDQDQLREAWRSISPASYLDRFAATSARAPKRNLLLWAKYDPCFLPRYSRNVLDAFERLHLDYEAHALACGHYTIGRVPFKYLDAYWMVRFLRQP